MAQSDIARSSFKYRATRQWNELPVEIKQFKTINEFKVELRKWIIDNVSIK